MLWLIQNKRAPHLALHSSKDTSCQFLHHPGIRMLWRDGIGSLESQCSGRNKTRAGIIAWMAEDKDQLDTGLFELAQAFPDQTATNTFGLGSGPNGKRSKD